MVLPAQWHSWFGVLLLDAEWGGGSKAAGSTFGRQTPLWISSLGSRLPCSEKLFMLKVLSWAGSQRSPQIACETDGAPTKSPLIPSPSIKRPPPPTPLSIKYSHTPNILYYHNAEYLILRGGGRWGGSNIRGRRLHEFPQNASTPVEPPHMYIYIYYMTYNLNSSYPP